MRGVYRFEHLRVWQAAKVQCDRVGELMHRPESKHDYGLVGQMNEASISVANNIAEGQLKSCLYTGHGRQYLETTKD